MKRPSVTASGGFSETETSQQRLALAGQPLIEAGQVDAGRGGVLVHDVGQGDDAVAFLRRQHQLLELSVQVGTRIDAVAQERREQLRYRGVGTSGA